jgi:Immunity protein 35
MRYEDARRLASAWVESCTGGGGVVVDEHTLSRSYGWVFFYQAKGFIESGDAMQAYVGNAPIVINRFSNEVHVTGTARPLEQYLAEYEAGLPAAQLVAGSEPGPGQAK